MLVGDSLAGLPVALYTLGSALAAYLVGAVAQGSEDPISAFQVTYQATFLRRDLDYLYD